MNFDFVKECRMESTELQRLYQAISMDLDRAEKCYWSSPRESGIRLRAVAEKVCRIYNLYYEIGCAEGISLEEYLCYTNEEKHDAVVSRFLSTAGKVQRDRLNRLRVLGDDCIAGEAAPDLGMTFEDRMGQNAKRMMETAMDLLKEMCTKINRRDDLQEKCFLEEALPEQKIKDEVNSETEERKQSWIARLFS